ncbi:A24 family peptidase [Staphylococcus cornubiensis]|uniref:prepilin peptidase n=1 Tax=Staphylococcus cornubiensis TaxID=1986155 RepID=UPI00198082B9|nr:A24 family peptidase [Staphylococcus cornubiensis]
MIVLLFMIGSMLMSFLLQFAEHPSLRIKHCFQRSKCQTCKHQLKPFDLIPLVSYCCLKGKCRYCKQGIPLSLFVGEALGGILIVYPLFIPIYIPLVTFYSVSLLLLSMAIIDVRSQLIPHRYLFILLILLLSLHSSFYLDCLHIVVWSVLLIVGLIQQNLIGMGDIKLFLVIIFFFPNAFLLFFLTFIFPLGLLLLPLSLVFEWIQQRRVPLVPAIFVSFLSVSSLYSKLILFYGGFL